MYYKSLSRWLDGLLPDAVLERPDSTLEMKIRARILLGLFLSNFSVCVALFIIFSLATLLTDKSFIGAITVISAIFVVLIMQAWMFRTVGNVSVSAIMFSMTFFAVTLIPVIATGGWHSPIKLLFFCAPVISFLVGGRQEGIYMATLVMCCGLALMLTSALDFQLFQMLPVENIQFMTAAIWVVSIVMLVSCLLVYDVILEDLSRRLNTRE